MSKNNTEEFENLEPNMNKDVNLDSGTKENAQMNATAAKFKEVNDLLDIIHRDASMFKPATNLCYDEPNDNVDNSLKNEEDEAQLDEQLPIRYNDAVNSKALGKNERTYRLEKFEKNAIIVFNQENLEGYLPRKGTEEDVKAICETFSKFGFVDIENNVHKDLTKVDLFKKLQEFSEKDFTDYGCIVIVILTIGTKNGLLSAQDQFYSEHDVINHFKSQNPTLFTKPVVLLIQASRGPYPPLPQEVPIMGNLKFPKKYEDDDIESYHLPVEADMLIAHSSFVGRPSFRTIHGSWFIQTVCKYINELYLTHDLESILVEVKREIAINKYYMEFDRGSEDLNVLKQMPTITSTLIRKLYLRKFSYNPLYLTPIELLRMETLLDSIPITPGVTNESFPSHLDHLKKCLRDAVLNLPPTHSYDEHEQIENTIDESLNRENKINDKENEELPTKYNEISNTKALSKYDRTYRLERFEKNAIIIFNQENIESYQPRVGTKQDVKAICKTFSKFGFVIDKNNIHDDLSKVELFKKLKEFSEKDFTDYGCIVIVILTHGMKNGLLRARDEGQLYSELDVINHFKSQNKPTLLTKPVVLLIQACRGTASTVGMAVMQKLKIAKDHDDTEYYHLPVEADMLIAHSSFVGKSSFRPDTGTWFIQTVCKYINELYLTHDLESILVEVKREIAINKYYMELNRRTETMDVNKQMPTITSTLIRKLYLRKYGDDPLLAAPIELTLLDSLLVPNTPKAADESCTCYMKHFDYMKRCLRHFVDENVANTTARCLLDIANLESGTDGEKTKATLRAISDCLHKHCKGSEYHKFIYYYHEFDGTDSIENIEQNRRVSSGFLGRVKESWVKVSQNYAVRGLGTAVGAYLVYNLIRK
uniref:Caspase family p20 domain-containing protein n=2 Tax=Pectinophora gossypiella TaxID=13191 RepID=A0A1E1WKK4_PECGO